VEVLTPPSIVAAITAGYQPLVHASALVTDDGDQPQRLQRLRMSVTA
jgi:hypothetical protein